MRDLQTPLPYVQVKGGGGEKEEGAWGVRKNCSTLFSPTVCSPSEERGGGTDGKKAEANEASEEQNIFPDKIAWFVISQLFFRMFPPSRAAAPLWAVLLFLLLNLCVVEVRVKKIFCVIFFMHAFLFF